MTKSDAARQLDDLAREVDLIVYRLELAGRGRAAAASSSGGTTGESQAPAIDGDRLRAELEDIKERLVDLSRSLDA